MNVEIQHNNTNITSRVIQYSREHQICTGIGRLQIVIEGTYLTPINPHDDIKIYENGDFKVKYYVSDVDRSAPDGTVKLECQDGSKYLVDYFIPESYTIDYPSYTRYWIELFLDQAGINYEFTTSSPGNLLSNYTQLGLQPAYDQIMMLCQLSGWYFYFDGNGKVIIGSLTTDLSSGGSIGKTDILEIKKITDDKMLRNRAVVWGQYDPIRQEYAYADISKHTSWNYDHDDLRTMVISNNNIPNKSSAYNIANILLKEFAKATIEKHIRIHGARDFNLGETLRVDSHVWKGKGLITTFGVSVDRAGGLVTNVILDERCPRLFGFFDFGDYVYVGTFGDGVWRKHIKFDPAWYNFSTGLTDLNITDLHINNGVFGSVAHSGQMYISSSEEGPWYNVAVEGLDSSIDDIVSPGSGIQYTTFSGINGRAAIVDRSTNRVKFGVDNWSGLNTGDYFLTYSGLNDVLNISGIDIVTGTTVSGSHRGWILEYDPFDGSLVGGLGSGIYPVHYSGYYDLIVLDLENDGRNDYVSVKLGNALSSNLGRHQNMPYAEAFDLNNKVFVPQVSELDAVKATIRVSNQNSVITISDSINQEYTLVYLEVVNPTTSPTLRLTEKKFYRKFNEDEGQLEVQVDTVSSSTINYNIHRDAHAVVHLGGTLYALYYSRVSNQVVTYYRRLWDSLLPGTMGAEESVYSVDFTAIARFGEELPDNGLSLARQQLVINNILYDMVVNIYGANTHAGLTFVPTYVYITIIQVNLLATTGSHSDIFEYVTEQHPDYQESGDTYRNIGGQLIKMNRNGESITINGWIGEDYSNALTPVDFKLQAIDWYVSGGLGGISMTKIYETENTPTLDFVNNEPIDLMITRDIGALGGGLNKSFYWQVNYNSWIIEDDYSSPSELGYYGFYIDEVQGLVPIDQPLADLPYLLIDNIFPLYAGNQFYIVRTAAFTYWLCLSSSKSPMVQFSAPPGWTLIKPLSTPNTLNNSEYYWILREDSESEYYLVPASQATFFMDRAMKLGVTVAENNRPAMIQGNFIVPDVNWETALFTTTGEQIDVVFLNIDPIPGYMVLQREGSDFRLIDSAAKPLRIDISNTSPVLTAQDTESTFKSNFVYGNEVTQISNSEGALILTDDQEIRDYRYALLETLSGIVVSSGSPVTTQILEATWSGIFTSDASTYSGGFILWKEIPSGFAERIETSNYVYPGQYVFVTTSGDNPMFFQKDNDSMFFDSYSGLPDSRATIIRVDDRL